MQVLSQQEIELLSEIIPPDAGGSTIAPAAVAPALTATGRTVKHYDFRRPDKFSKDHLRALRIVFGSFSALLASGFSSYLRTNVQARLSNVEQVTYDEYIRGLASPTILYIITLAPLPGQIVLELDLRLSRAILDRLLGGNGQPSPILRELTEIELALLKTLRTVLAGCLREAWSGVYAIEPDLREPTLSPEFVQVTLPGESTIRLALEVVLLGVTGHVTLCLPHPVLQPVLDDLSAQVRFASGQGRAVEDAPLDPREELCQVAVPIAVELGRAMLSMRELLRLDVGQVIKLDTPATGDLPVRVGEQSKFWGRPGVIGRNLALQVTRVSEL